MSDETTIWLYEVVAAKSAGRRIRRSLFIKTIFWRLITGSKITEKRNCCAILEIRWAAVALSYRARY